MSTIKDGGPAFPLRDCQHVDGEHYGEAGMTLRDYFATKAMEGDFASQFEHGFSTEGVSGRSLARRYYEMADAMLAEREKAAQP